MGISAGSPYTAQGGGEARRRTAAAGLAAGRVGVSPPVTRPQRPGVGKGAGPRGGAGQWPRARAAVGWGPFRVPRGGGGRALPPIPAGGGADEPVRLAPPVLMIDDGHVQRMFESLPGPRAQAPTASPDGPRWQAGF